MVNVSIIIVNYNVAHYIANLLNSIRKYVPDGSYEIIIVDNNSNEKDKQQLSELSKYHHVKYIQLDKNYGFSKANNIGAKQAHGKYLLLLNPDTLLIEDSLKKVLAFRYEKNQKCIIGIKLLNSDLSLQPSRNTFPCLFDYFSQAFFLNTLFRKSKIFNRVNYGCHSVDGIREVDSVKGAFLFVDKEVFDDLSGLDEKYFLYAEEMEFCYSAKKNGIKTFYYPNTSIIHFGEASTVSKSIANFRQLHRSQLFFVYRHNGYFYMILFRIVLIFSTFNRFILNGILFLRNRNQIKFKEKSMLFLHGCAWLCRPGSFSKLPTAK